MTNELAEKIRALVAGQLTESEVGALNSAFALVQRVAHDPWHAVPPHERAALLEGRRHARTVHVRPRVGA